MPLVPAGGSICVVDVIRKHLPAAVITICPRNCGRCLAEWLENMVIAWSLRRTLPAVASEEGEGNFMSSDTRSHVHYLVDQLPPIQLAALETLLQSLIDPVARAAALAPPDDEPVTDEDRQRSQEGSAMPSEGKDILMQDVLAEFGLGAEDFPIRP